METNALEVGSHFGFGLAWLFTLKQQQGSLQSPSLPHNGHTQRINTHTYTLIANIQLYENICEGVLKSFRLYQEELKNINCDVWLFGQIF